MATEITLREKAYLHIRGRLLSGELSAGQVLSEASLASELGISRTPVREAIQQLEQEGVVEQVARYGTVVRRIGREDLVELFELREALEAFGVARAAERIHAEDTQRLDRLVGEIKNVAGELRDAKRVVADEAAMKRLLAADMAFHLILLQAAGNRRLLETVTRTRLLARIFGTPRQEHDLVVVDEIHEQHGKILVAVRERDPEAARHAMVEHIRSSQRRALDHHERRIVRLENPFPADVMETLDRVERAAQIKEQTLATDGAAATNGASAKNGASVKEREKLPAKRKSKSNDR